MAKKLEKQRTEADRITDDSSDPVLKMLDDEEITMQEIFDVLGWDPIPAELFENQVKKSYARRSKGNLFGL